MSNKVIWSRYENSKVDIIDVLTVDKYVAFNGANGYDVLRVTEIDKQNRTVRVVPHCPGRTRKVLMDKIIAVYQRC